MPAQVPTLHPSLLMSTLVIMAWILTSQVALLAYLLKGGTLWPEPAPRPAPWNSRGVLGVLLLWIALQVVGSIVVSKMGDPAATTNAARISPRELMIASGMVNLGLILFGPLILAWSARVSLSELDLLGPDPLLGLNRGIGSWPVLVPWIYAIYFGAQQIWGTEKHPIEEMIRGDRSWATIVISSVTAVVLAPIAEEFLFRGVLLGWLTKLTLRSASDTGEEQGREVADSDDPEASPTRKPYLLFWAANLVTSILFSTLHSNVWPSPIPLFLLSIGLGVLYQRTGGLAAPIALHMTFNGIATLILQLSLIGVESKPPAPANPPAVEAVRREIPLSVDPGHRLEEKGSFLVFSIGANRADV